MASPPIQTVTDGGIAADHAVEPVLPSLVAPTTARDHNTIKMPLVPLACWRANDMRFEFESSIVSPGLKADVDALNVLVERHTLTGARGRHKPSLSVFGHADPTGNDDFNKLLAGRRAQAIFAMLTREVDLWDDLFLAPLGNDKWNPRALDIMQDTLKIPVGPRPDPAARRALFKAYMDHLCTVRDPNGDPVQFRLTRADFLAGGADRGGKGDFQGCGEFNPVLMFSKDENDAFKDPALKPERDAENAPNRRVMILLFRPGAKVSPSLWPCPRVKEGTAACRKRFWSDAEQRRQFQAKRRLFKNTQDTFACRFYHRLAVSSPCEGELKPLLLFALFDVVAGERDRSVELVVFDGGGKEVQSIRGTRETEDPGGFFVFRVDPANLPDPVRLQWRNDEGVRHLAGPCSPVQLRDALASPDLKTGHVLVREPTEAPGGSADFPPDDPMAGTALLRPEDDGLVEIV